MTSDSRESISVMVVSLTHPSSSTYQCWIFTCCFTVNPLLSQSPSATLCFHCHHHREPRGTNSAVRFGGPSAALHSWQNKWSCKTEDRAAAERNSHTWPLLLYVCYFLEAGLLVCCFFFFFLQQWLKRKKGEMKQKVKRDKNSAGKSIWLTPLSISAILLKLDQFV